MARKPNIRSIHTVDRILDYIPYLHTTDVEINFMAQVVNTEQRVEVLEKLLEEQKARLAKQKKELYQSVVVYNGNDGIDAAKRKFIAENY